ncbi:MAG TPA: TIGR03854 family LLM class F420-dependent oxidoreductase [Streptosporangiaceae bacterium]|nr:TIGR03854 family LLM class F420-dependent oxidoreductase [Streptosporangiaceae bacterium]
MSLKVRIGIALGPWADAARYSASVDRLEELGVDSLWISELVFGSLVEPFIGMAHALARTNRLKVGTGVAILPGRHPVLVAKQLASLAALAPGRVLPAFGLQPARAEERALFPVPPGRRAAVFDESLELLRLLLREESVSFTGQYFTVEEASVGPLPAKPLDIWTGGSAPGALRRTGRLADGWLGSFLTPAEAGAARETIQAAAADAGREIEEDHFGISLAVVTGAGGSGEAGGDVPASLVKSVRARRPDADPADLYANGWADARKKIEQYVAVGLSKFVVRPAVGEDASESGLDEFLERFASEMGPLQS